MSHTLQPEAYRAMARYLRRVADTLDAVAAPATAIEQRRLTIALNGLSRRAQALSQKHRRKIS